jgi:hypothetical protein
MQVRQVPYRPEMAHRQIADVRNVFHNWRVAANILNKQSRIADKREVFQLGNRQGASNPSCHKISQKVSVPFAKHY